MTTRMSPSGTSWKQVLTFRALREGQAPRDASILVGDAGENMIVSVPGTNGDVGHDSVDELLGNLMRGDWLMLQLEIPSETVLYALRQARDRSVKTILNTAPFTRDAVELSKLADVVVMNESEMAEAMHHVGECLEPVKMLHGLISSDHGKLVVVTRGKDGAVSYDGRTLTEVSALSIEPVDTVGAGDTFVGYLAAGSADDLPISSALKRAAIAASLACLKHGAQPGIPFASDVEQHIKC